MALKATEDRGVRSFGVPQGSPSSFLGKEPASRDRSAHKRALLLIGPPTILSASEASRYMPIMSHFAGNYQSAGRRYYGFIRIKGENANAL